jgi:tetratricopeptide (TPR) repeat protein
MYKVFLSYRRRETSFEASCMAERLRALLGPEAVFLDESSIGPGEDFRRRIEAAMKEATVVVAVIGSSFPKDLGPVPGAEDPVDFMVWELDLAIRLGRRVIPVLVNGADVPSVTRLPPSLRELARRDFMNLDAPGSLEKLASAVIQAVLRGSSNALEPEPPPLAAVPDTSTLFTPVAEIVHRLEVTGSEFGETLLQNAWLLADAVAKLRVAILLAAHRQLGIGLAASPTSAPPRDTRAYLQHGRVLEGTLRREGTRGGPLPESLQEVLQGSAPPLEPGPQALRSIVAKLPEAPGPPPGHPADLWEYLDGLLAHQAFLERHAGQVGPALAAELRAWLHQARWLWRYRVGFVSGDGDPRAGGGNRGAIWEGLRPIATSVTCRERVAPETLVFDPAGACLPVTPFFHVFSCNHLSCQGPRVFAVLDRLDRSPRRYRHAACGHTVETSLLDVRWATLLRAPDPAQAAALVCLRARSPGPRAIHCGEAFTVHHHVSNTTGHPVGQVSVALDLPAGVELLGPSPAPLPVLPPGGRVDLAFQMRTLEHGRLVIPPARLTWRTADGQPAARLLSEISFPVVFGTPATFIGREAELARLRQAHDQATAGTLRLISIHGAAGVGKTALAQAFLAELLGQQRGETVVLKTRCVRDDQNAPGAVGDLLKRYLHYYVDPAAVESAVQAVRGRRLEHFFLRPVHLFDLLKIFANAVGLEAPLLPRPAPEADLSSEGRGDNDCRGELHAAVLDMFLHITSLRPVVLFVDDAHFMHRDDWTLLRYLVRQLQGRSVMVMAAAPPVPQVRGQHLPTLVRAKTESDAMQALRDLRFEPILLQTLPEEDARLLLDVMLQPGAAIEEPVRKEIVRASHGVPAHLVGILRELHASGQLQRAQGAWRHSGPLALVLEKVMKRRYQALPADLQALLQTASVLGQRFDPRLLAELEIGGSRLTTTEISEAAAQLSEFLREVDFGYEFVSDRVFHLVYDGIDQSERQALHRHAAQILARQNQGEAALGMLAFHWRRAGEIEQAIDCLDLYAIHLEKNLAFDEAIRALESIQDLWRRQTDTAKQNRLFDLVRRQSRLNWISNYRERAIALDRENVERGRELHRFADVCEILRILSKSFFDLGRLEDARQHARDAYDLARRHELPTAMHKANLQLALLDRDRRDYEGAERRLRECANHGRSAGEPWLEAEALRNLGFLALKRGEYTAAEEHLECAVRLFEGLAAGAGRFGLRLAHQNRAALSEQLGQLETAEYQIRQSLRLREEAQDVTGLARGYHVEASILFKRGKLREARERLQESMRLKRRLEDDAGLVKSFTLQGHFEAETDQWAAAIESYRAALALLGRPGRTEDAVPIQIALTLVYCRWGRLPDAEASFQPVLAVVRERLEPSLQSEVELAQARLAHAGGRSEEAWQRVQTVSNNARLPEGSHQRHEATMFQAVLLLERGEPDRAIALIRQALPALVGLPFLRTRMGNLLGKALRQAGRLPEALAQLHENRTQIARIEDPLGEAIVLDHIADVELAMGRPEAARRHLEQALLIKRGLGDELGVSISQALLDRCPGSTGLPAT